MIFALLPAAYLLGSIPFGLLIGRCCGVDVREVGSGNIGATNVWRACGWRAGLPCFLLDVLKGVAPTAAARLLQPDLGWLPVAAGGLAVAGHTFSPWLGFRGGKGVATSLGVVAALDPLAAGLGFGCWVVLLALTRIVSVASLAGSLAAAAGVWCHPAPPLYRVVICLGVALIWVRHRANIGRLLRGEEHRFGRPRDEHPLFSRRDSSPCEAGGGREGGSSGARESSAQPPPLPSPAVAGEGDGLGEETGS